MKTLNDSLGHHAGDEALIKISECMMEVTSQDTQAYRIGGDEFVVLFFRGDEDKIAQLTEQVKSNASGDGYSLSVGYAMRNGNLEETIKQSDSRMYEDKANYYHENGRDRRRRSQQ